jgi:four helix bundle protein
VTGASRYDELIVWQLANELLQKVLALTAAGPVSRDFKFRDQLRDAAASVTRNVAEGFGRGGDAEFAAFLRTARGSLTETHTSLRDGQGRGYFTEAQTDDLQRLARRAAKAATGLIRYLESPAAKPHRKGRSPRRTPWPPKDLRPLDP